MNLAEHPTVRRFRESDRPDNAKDDAEHDQRVLIAGLFHHGVDRERGQDGTEAVAGGDNTGRETAPIRKPADHEADNSDVDDAGTEAAEQPVGQIKTNEACRIGGADPPQARQQAAGRNQRARAEPVDQIALDGRKEGLQHNENGEGDLDGRQRGTQGFLQRFGEERPYILWARDRHHRDQPKYKLKPTRRCPGLSRSPCSYSHFIPVVCCPERF